MSFGSQTYPRSRSRTRRTLASSQRKGVDGAVVKKKAPITASRGREDRWTTRQDDDSLQAHWAKHGPKYNHVCKVIVAEGGSDIANVFESQPDDSKPFGIRCTVWSEAHKAGIIMSNGWTDYTYKGSMRQGVRQIQVEDLRKAL